jgi:hypothetical protein
MAEPGLAGLAGLPPQELAFEDLLDTGPALPPDEVREQVSESLGIGARRVRYAGGLPDVSDLREQLGLE